MRYVIVENIWSVAQRVVTWFAFEDSAEDFLDRSDRDYQMITLTKEELQKAIENDGYIE